MSAVTPAGGAIAAGLDAFDPDLALRAPELLRTFNRAGVLSAADIHVARVIARLAGAGDARVLLAVALAVRAPRTGHVFVDLATVSATAAVEAEETVDLAALPWPPVEAWVAELRRCTGLVALGEEEVGGAGGSGGAEGAAARPVRLIGTRLYLDRYWREERALAATLAAFSQRALRPVELDPLADRLHRLFPGEGALLQRAAAACAALRGLTVIAGGPGTGKTTTVARVAALLIEGAVTAGEPPPLIALCAPTGKAAARLGQAVHDEAIGLPVDDTVRAALLGLNASTIHRLLGWRPGSHSRFRHDAGNRLPHDVVIVDETSMVALTLMGRLLEAVRADARVVFVGDPDQLSAIEAGAVLRDIVGPAASELRMSGPARVLLGRVLGGELPGAADGGAADGGAARSFGDGVVVLRRGYRFGQGIGAVAAAIGRGDSDGVLTAIAQAPDEEVLWLDVDPAAVWAPGGAPASDAARALAPVRAVAVHAGSAVFEAARGGDGAAALDALTGFRLLCAHRRGPYGVAVWSGQIEHWLADAVAGFAPGERDYAGRPLLITENDYELRLFNGDTGVIIREREGDGESESEGEERLSAAFERDGELVMLAPSRLGSAETLYAMTIHKSQGSQFEIAAVVLPDPSSRILTRELLYTAVTRARRRLILVGSEAAVRAAVERPVARASGLRDRLWNTPEGPY